MRPYLRVENISKVFPGVRALSDVSADFFAGDIHVLLGENGAGKSTLIKIISGVYQPTEGRVILEDREVVFSSPRNALDAGISVIHQELSIANDLSVAENIYLGKEPRKKEAIFLDRRKMETEAQNVLDFMEVDIRAKTVARELTAAQQQMVEIAKVITNNSKVVIMDEPTSSLSEHEIRALFRQIAILKKNNIAIIYITHRLKEIFEIGNRVTVLRDGRKVDTFFVKDVTEKKMVASMVGREMKDYYNRTQHNRGQEALRVEGLTRNGEFSDISFSAYSGEILGISGLIGAGRTEVMETVFGARRAHRGRVFVRGEEVFFKSPMEAIRAKIGMVTEDRRRTGLMISAKTKNNMVLPSLVDHHKKFGILDLKWEDVTSREYVDKLHVKTPGIDTLISALSGGNQQKVILAKWMIANSEILILDEPTRGIDVNAKSEFYALMNEFVAAGGCIVMISSELPEILGISDRILVMCEGRLTGELDFREATEEKIMELASPD
ncbi:MAG: sugar ABC transporter ATP-binding protein [Spirochaetaceae bacterium]|jgi:ABC-type sugar transport system ATPase subunit|nr:sugar ABC transporter ATP-binding protein [Spirochaetaceae bacterium]